ncbi:MAG TPA: hypothetical protein VFM06_07520 [Candidatus Limnocylindria bacterium]|nr:hypothetical protein [Candidatus Limnocylindria bacterium]
MAVGLSPRETQFVEAIRHEFRYLAHDYGLVEKPLWWNAEGISIDHSGMMIEVSNFLEAEQSYTTFLFPLRGGARLPVFDAEMDEPFTYFLIEHLSDDLPPGVASASFLDETALLTAVAARARFLREHIAALLGDDGSLLAEIRDRRRQKLLQELVPKWLQFVDGVRRGFDGPSSAYVAGINIRGEIRSILSWSGSAPPEMEEQLREADAQFDAATEAVPLEPGSVRVMPHPRAARWFRRPKRRGLVGS